MGRDAQRRRAEALDRFWDDLIADGAAEQSAEVDAEPVHIVRQLAEFTAIPGLADARQRIWERLVHDTSQHAAQELSTLNARDFDRPLPSWGAIGRHDAASPIGLPRRLPSRRHLWGIAQFATAALLLVTLLASYFAFGPGRSGRQPDAPAFMLAPATAGYPEVPTAEFVWQIKGGPDLPFDDPFKVAIDPQGNLWIPGGSSGRFLLFAPDGTFLEAWGTPGSGNGQFNLDYGGYGYGAVVWDTDGNFYVTDPGNRRIQKFGPDREFIRAWGSEGVGNGQFLGMGSIAIDKQGRLYAADHGRDDVQVFDLNGRFLDAWDGSETKEGQFGNPGGIAVDAAGNLYICEYNSHRIRKVTPDGATLAAWGRFGSNEGEFSNPNDVAIDEQGRVYVADWGNDRVQVFDADGRFLSAWGDSGTEPGQFLDPTGVTPDGYGAIYVADESDDRVQKFLIVPP